MTDRIASKQPRRSRRRIAFSLSTLAGAGYTAAWIISLSVGAPNPSVAAPGSQVVAAIAGRGARRWPSSPSTRASRRLPWLSW